MLPRRSRLRVGHQQVSGQSSAESDLVGYAVRGEVDIARRKERQDLLPDLLEKLAVARLPDRVLLEVQVDPVPVCRHELRAGVLWIGGLQHIHLDIDARKGIGTAQGGRASREGHLETALGTELGEHVADLVLQPVAGIMGGEAQEYEMQLSGGPDGGDSIARNR